MRPTLVLEARVAAALAVSSEVAFEAEVRAALGGGVAPADLHELVLQSYLFVGFPRTINALIALRKVAGDTLPPPAADPGPATLAAWQERGQAACRLVYGERYERLVANMRALHPDLAQWMEVEGYGKVLARPHLDFARRELAVLAILAATGMERQLVSHVHGALHAGASPDEIRTSISTALCFAAPDQEPRIAAALEAALSR